MVRSKNILLAAAGLIAITGSIVFAETIKTFVPNKPWQVTIDLNDFVPSDVLDSKTILGGSTKDNINVTIIIEKTKPGTKSSEMRKLYGYKYALGSGQKQTIEEIDLNDIAVITYKWAVPNIPDTNKAEQVWVKDVVKNMWGFNGYVVKDDIAFDIHLSTDMTRHTKKQLLDIIKSLRITPSNELEETSNLFKSVDANPDSQKKEKLLADFIGKYPTNPDAYCFLAEHYLQTGRLEDTKTAYFKALENHKVQAFIDPLSLWKSYYGLGRYFATSKEYEQSERYTESCYELAKKAKMLDPFVASSAYSLACIYAETDRPDKSLNYLRESVRLNSRYKEKAKKERAFAKMKDNLKFQNILNR